MANPCVQGIIYSIEVWEVSAPVAQWIERLTSNQAAQYPALHFFFVVKLTLTDKRDRPLEGRQPGMAGGLAIFYPEAA